MLMVFVQEGRVKFHMHRRLAKALVYSGMLLKLCKARADERTCVEAEVATTLACPSTDVIPLVCGRTMIGCLARSPSSVLSGMRRWYGSERRGNVL